MKITPLRRSMLALAILAWALPSPASAQSAPADDATQRWARFEPEFQAFAAADRATTPRPGGILFVGSSIFRQWTNVAEMMAPLPVLNRAFGGSRTGDQLERFDQVVTPYAPKVIVYYCGSNDLKAGDVTEDPAQIFARFRTFSERVRAVRPSTRIIFVSSTRSPDRVARWDQVDHYNALVRAYSAATPGHTYIDVNPALVDADGRPRLELYKDDKLHFHPPAYARFAGIIRPVLERVWREVEAKEPAPAGAGGVSDRARWIRWLDQIARPVLTAGAAQDLHSKLPVAQGTLDRVAFSRLEAVGRLLSGMAPWLESDATVSASETALRVEYRRLALKSIASLVDPLSPDRVDAAAGSQILVDTAFLAEAFLRAPRQLWGELPESTKTRVVELMLATRRIKPGPNNWLLFSATVEAFFVKNSLPWDPMRVDYALRQHEQWYKGDGYYGDGAEFHFDYYNSIVIHPMLLDVLAAVGPRENWAAQGFPARMLSRAQRHAAILERLISPEGALPPVGRSLAYRSGVLHGLAQIALLEQLPSPISPAQVRCGMTAALRRVLEAPGTFDAAGWLRIGLAGAQPAMGETYISTGSLYLAAAAFLPLGLPPENPFWSAPEVPWTSARIYAGENGPRDQALKER